MTWVKICGITTAEAVSAAVQADVDALGFVFTHSSRRVTPRDAAQLAAPARGRVSCAAVMRHPTQALVDEVMQYFQPDFLQADWDDLEKLQLPETLGVLPVFRGGMDARRKLPCRLLFEGPVSGSGKLADWQAAADLARRAELILAGGLNETNVAAAIVAVKPFGVDVSSGVEGSPGCKSPAAIARFVAAVRAIGAAARAEEMT